MLYELWKAYSKEDQNACSAYLRLQGERRHLNAAYQRARNCDRHWSWFELEDWRLTEYGTHLMAAISLL